MNEGLLLQLYSLAQTNSLTKQIIVFLAESSPLIVVGILAGIWLFSRRQDRRYFFYLMTLGVLSGTTAWLIASILKEVFDTQRPFLVIDNIKPLVEVSQASGAFPSGHTSFLFGLAVFSWFWLRRLSAYALLFLAFIGGVSRVMVGLHWPLDILGGIVVGLVIAVFFNWAIKKLKLESRLRILRPGH